MAELNVALILKLVDRATGPARAAMQALERIGGQSIMAQAEKVARGSRMMADGVAQVGRSALQTGAVLAAYTGTLSAIGLAFVRPAAQFERFNVQLTNLEGSAEGAKTAMRWIEDFATRTPLEMDQTVAAYAKLRAFGIDPTNGTLQALVDTMAATGGGAEQLDGIVLALGQAWTKQKLQGEEAMQLLERGIPVWDILSEKTGKNAAELMEMASAGKLGRAEITMLIEALGEKNDGAAEKMSQTWDGIISNLLDQWSRFQRMVMDAELFQYMKGRLQELLNFLNAAAADGRLQAWAEATAKAVMTAMQAIYGMGVGLYNIWNAVWPVLDQVAQTVGGWDVVGWAAAFLFFKSTIMGAFGGLMVLTRGLMLLVGGLTGAGAIAVFKALGAAALWLGRAFLIAGRFLLANPIIAVISAIAGLAFVIYQNWDGIVGYFTEKIDRVRAAFDQGLLNGVLKALSEFNPFKLMADSAVGLLEYLTGWDLTPVQDHLYSIFAIDLVDAGIAMIASLWEGMKAKFAEVSAWWTNNVTALIPGLGSAGVDAGPQGSSTTGESFDIGAGKELGGPVRRGVTYPVGERGVELFTPDRDGYIIPNRKLAGGGGRGGGTVVNVGNITIPHLPGMTPQTVQRMVGEEFERRLREARFALNDGGAYA